MRKEMVSANMIIELHEVMDESKLNNIVASMIADGYVGRPILLIDGVNNAHIACSGSHRVAAARIAGIEVDALIIEQDDINEEFVGEWDYANDDDDRERVLREFGLDDAADLMSLEIASNDKEWS